MGNPVHKRRVRIVHQLIRPLLLLPRGKQTELRFVSMRVVAHLLASCSKEEIEALETSGTAPATWTEAHVQALLRQLPEQPAVAASTELHAAEPHSRLPVRRVREQAAAMHERNRSRTRQSYLGSLTLAEFTKQPKNIQEQDFAAPLGATRVRGSGGKFQHMEPSDNMCIASLLPQPAPVCNFIDEDLFDFIDQDLHSTIN